MGYTKFTLREDLVIRSAPKDKRGRPANYRPTGALQAKAQRVLGLVAYQTLRRQAMRVLVSDEGWRTMLREAIRALEG